MQFQVVESQDHPCSCASCRLINEKTQIESAAPRMTIEIKWRQIGSIILNWEEINLYGNAYQHISFHTICILSYINICKNQGCCCMIQRLQGRMVMTNIHRYLNKTIK